MALVKVRLKELADWIRLYTFTRAQGSRTHIYVKNIRCKHVEALLLLLLQNVYITTPFWTLPKAWNLYDEFYTALLIVGCKKKVNFLELN